MHNQVNWRWALLSIAAGFLYGFLCFIMTALWQAPEVVMIIKFSTFCILAGIGLLLYPERTTLLRNKQLIILVILGTFINWIELIGFVLAGSFAGRSQAPGGLLTSFEYSSLIVSFMVGRFLFDERQKLIQYFGCLLAVMGMIFVTLSNDLDKVYHIFITPVLGIEKPENIVNDEIDMPLFYLSIILHIFTGILYSAGVGLVKYANHYYQVSEYGFSLCIVFFSSIPSIISAGFMSPDFTQLRPQNLFLNNYLCILVGFIGISAFVVNCKAAASGDIQITMIIVSAYPFVQLFCEMVAFGSMPTLFQIFGMCLILMGTSLIILCEEKNKKKFLVKTTESGSTITRSDKTSKTITGGEP